MIEITATLPEIRALVRQHRRLSQPDFVHTDLEPGLCACAIGQAHEVIELAPGVWSNSDPMASRPRTSGNSCRDCGGMMVRTGTCETCTECGSTGGCG